MNKRGAAMASVGAVLFVFVALGLTGCPDDGGDGNANGNANGNDNGGGGVLSGGFDDNGLEAPAPLPGGVENVAPTGALVFPPEGVEVGRGDVVFLWEAADADASNIDSRVFLSASPDVFGDPIVTPGERTAPGVSDHRLTIQLPDDGKFFWGVEVTDGVNTVRIPDDGVGVMFEVTTAIPPIVDAEGVILLCPRATQPARAVTTFSWDLGDNVPSRSQVFVSRADVENPFAAPLRVFDVSPANSTTRPLSDAEALPLGETLSWGLRLEAAGEVVFTFEGQVGEAFLVADNVPPSGALQNPDDGAVIADDTTSLVLSWTADPENCEEEVTSTVFFELLNAMSDEDSLFASPIAIDVPQGVTSLDVLGSGGPSLTAGVWQWGVLADDGTDATRLSDGLPVGGTHRTFIRDTGPRFVSPPTVTDELCAIEQLMYEALSFSFEDDNGLNTVGVTLRYAPVEANVFVAPSATLNPVPGVANGDGLIFLVATGIPECPDFDHGAGFYGVELDDGVNAPVQAVVEFTGPPVGACCLSGGSCVETIEVDCLGGSFQGDDTTCATVSCPLPPPPDCNGNGVPDAQDIAQGSSDDCNGNGIPDECEGSPLVIDAGTLLPGVINLQNAYDSLPNENDLVGTICPMLTQFTVLWTVESSVPGSEVFILSPTTFVSAFVIGPAVPGQYVFRLTVVGLGVSDTVTFDLQ